MPKRPLYSKKPKHHIKTGKIVDWPSDEVSPEEVAEKVTYTGHPKHKKYKSPAGHPAYELDAAECDHFAERDWHLLEDTLRQAIRQRCVGQFRGEFPSRAWAYVNDVLHEARLTGEGQGDYHGFPIDDERQYPLPHRTLEGRVPHVTIPKR